jgi:hypothetical protein
MVKMRRNIVLLFMGLMISACSALPITDGAYSYLPREGAVAILWGNNPAVIDTMSIWLHKQGVAPLEQNQLKQILKSQNAILTNSTSDEAIIVELARKMNADLVVFGNLNQEIRAPMVSVRGFDVSANQVAWEGSAHYDQYIQIPLNHALVVLTCQALATAWGLRESGKNWFKSPEKMCLVDSNAEK